jgi:hypothetical protein
MPHFYIMNRSLGGVQCGVDVPKSAIPKTSHRWIVLFAIRVGPHFSQQIGCFVQATPVVGGYIGNRMVVDIPAIVDGGAPNFLNRAIYFADRLTFMRAHGGITGPMFEHPPRSAQIRKRMQVSRVLAGLRNAPCE